MKSEGNSTSSSEAPKSETTLETVKSEAPKSETTSETVKSKDNSTSSSEAPKSKTTSETTKSETATASAAKTLPETGENNALVILNYILSVLTLGASVTLFVMTLKKKK